MPDLHDIARKRHPRQQKPDPQREAAIRADERRCIELVGSVPSDVLGRQYTGSDADRQELAGKLESLVKSKQQEAKPLRQNITKDATLDEIRLILRTSHPESDLLLLLSRLRASLNTYPLLAREGNRPLWLHAEATAQDVQLLGELLRYLY